MVHPEGNALPLMDPEDPPLGRASFANYHLWVTPYAPEERYAAGDYSNQSPPGQGLPTWTARARRVEETDIVLWYRWGSTTSPRRRMAGLQPGLALGDVAAYNFFDRNPALDVPPTEALPGPTRVHLR